VASLCSIDCSWLLSVLSVADSVSNAEMRTFSRIRAHQSTRETINTSLWRRKTKPAFFNDVGVLVLAPNKICGACLFCVVEHYVLKRTSFFNQCSRIFSGILDAQRPISLSPVIASDNSSIVFFDDTPWRSSAAAPLVILRLLSLLRRLDLNSTKFDFLSFYRFRRNTSAGLNCHCKIVTWIFLDLAATSSSLIFASFTF